MIRTYCHGALIIYIVRNLLPHVFENIEPRPKGIAMVRNRKQRVACEKQFKIFIWMNGQLTSWFSNKPLCAGRLKRRLCWCDSLKWSECWSRKYWGLHDHLIEVTFHGIENPRQGSIIHIHFSYTYKPQSGQHDQWHTDLSISFSVIHEWQVRSVESPFPWNLPLEWVRHSSSPTWWVDIVENGGKFCVLTGLFSKRISLCKRGLCIWGFLFV